MSTSNGLVVRGVWHPAFLEELRKIIVLDFYVAQSSLIAVERAFQSKQIQHVKAGFVRGTEDVMIRRYVPKYLTTSRGVPLSIPFCHYTDDQLRAIFATEERDPKLQVVIYPDKLLKYRGVEISQEEWLRASVAIEEVTHSSRDLDDLIKRSCKLASEFRASTNNDRAPVVPEDLKAIFSLPMEEYEPVDPESGGKREYYVFIRAQPSPRDPNPDPGFKKHVVMGVLIQHPCVREIAEIQQSWPHRFHYSIQVEAPSRDVDELIYQMHLWAEKNEISFGTRTYEVWRYLSRDATSGIEFTTIDEIERDFLVELKNADFAKDIRSLSFSNEQRKSLAELWQKSRNAVGRIDNCRKNMGDLYLHLTLFNFNGFQYRNLQDCKVAWQALTQQVERMAEDLLAIVLDVSSNDQRIDEIARAVEDKIPGTKTPATKQNEHWNAIKGYPWKIAAKYYNQIVGGKGLLLPVTRKHVDNIFKIRNWISHGGHEVLFREFVTLKQNETKWSDKLREVETATSQLRDVLLELNAEAEIAEQRRKTS